MVSMCFETFESARTINVHGGPRPRYITVQADMGMRLVRTLHCRLESPLVC